MENNKEYIDHLFSEKLGEFKIHATDEEWGNLNKSLTKTNFLKFNIRTFNFVYLIVMAAFFAGSVYLGFKNHLKSKTIELLENKLDSISKYIPNTNSSIQLSDSITKEIVNVNSENGNIDTSAVISPKKQKIEIKNSPIQKISSNSDPIKDKATEIKSDSTVINISTYVPNVKKVKKTVYTKTDTVVLKNTQK